MDKVRQKQLRAEMEHIGQHAREALPALAAASPAAKNKALREAAASIRANKQKLLDANAKDLEAAVPGQLSRPMIERLTLDAKRIEAMAVGLEEIAELPDPVGKTLAEWPRPNGLKIARVSVPLGVIGIIYESRPNVTADAGALCLKSGNAAILRGGSESFHSSQAIMECLADGLLEAELPRYAIQLVPTQNREAVGIMLNLPEYIDVIIPRGGKGLIQRIIDESKIPTLQHLDGNCHTYIHENADPAMAQKVVINAKMRRTGICGATESLVLDMKIAKSIGLPIIQELIGMNCEIRGDRRVQTLDHRVKIASDEDWGTEYLDAVLSVKVVDNLEEAITFINRHSSHHTDAIITENTQVAETFLSRIDSAIVMHNASTQFADGGEFGMGAEIGISTGRLHARGPVGVEQLTTYKYVVRGAGQVRPG